MSVSSDVFISYLQSPLSQGGQSEGVHQVRACSITAAKQKRCLGLVIALCFLLAALMSRNYRGQKYPGRAARTHPRPERHQLWEYTERGLARTLVMFAGSHYHTVMPH